MQLRSRGDLIQATEDIFYELWMLRKLRDVILALPGHQIPENEVEEAERQAYTHTTHFKAHFWSSEPVSPNPPPERFVVEHNALIEAFALHSRVLLEFFYAETNPKFPDDVRAEQYFPSAEAWRSVRPRLSKEDYDGIRNRVGKEIAHLTYARQLVTPEDKPWPILWITDILDEAASAFVSGVDERHIHPLLRANEFRT
jgi:hypothetical protein